MRWLDPRPITCSQCNRLSHVSIADLSALQAACPFCEFSFARIGQGMLDQEVRFNREVGPFIVGYELWQEFGWESFDIELDQVRTLNDLALLLSRYLSGSNDIQNQITHPTNEAAQLIRRTAQATGYAFLLQEEGSELIRACLERD